MNKYILLLGLALIAGACKKKTEEEPKPDNPLLKGPAPMAGYHLKSEHRNYSQRTDSIRVELYAEASRKDLTEIANSLKNERKEFEKVWIFYYLSGQADTNKVWATTHFTPDLNVVILNSGSNENLILPGKEL